jgi:predicted protein tyrosine phosphatase
MSSTMENVGASVAGDMHVDSFRQQIKIVGIAKALGLCPAELAGWNILSIRGQMNEAPLSLPGARRTKVLLFDDVQTDRQEDGEFAARPEDIQAALAFSREIEDEPLLIHCAAGISRSTAVAWIIIYDKLKEQPGDAVRRSFDIVRKLRPILDPNRHVLRLGIEALVPQESRQAVMQEFCECLAELERGNPVFFSDDFDEDAPS